jgi:hypothetical protein
MRRRLWIWLLVAAGVTAGAVAVRHALIPERPIPAFDDPRHEGLRYDPIEDDPRVQPILAAPGGRPRTS